MDPYNSEDNVFSPYASSIPDKQMDTKCMKELEDYKYDYNTIEGFDNYPDKYNINVLKEAANPSSTLFKKKDNLPLSPNTLKPIVVDKKKNITPAVSPISSPNPKPTTPVDKDYKKERRRRNSDGDNSRRRGRKYHDYDRSTYSYIPYSVPVILPNEQIISPDIDYPVDYTNRDRIVTIESDSKKSDFISDNFISIIFIFTTLSVLGIYYYSKK